MKYCKWVSDTGVVDGERGDEAAEVNRAPANADDY
jgi:hypothetical protein